MESQRHEAIGYRLDMIEPISSTSGVADGFHVNHDNVLQVRAILAAEAKRIARSVNFAKYETVQRCGDDPASFDVQMAFAHKVSAILTAFERPL